MVEEEARQRHLKDLLYRACPVLFRHAIRAERTRTPEQWNRVASEGFAVPSTWMPLVFLALRKMERLASRMPHPPYVVQVKEKLGELRINFRWYRKLQGTTAFGEAAEQIVARAEERLLQKGMRTGEH